MKKEQKEAFCPNCEWTGDATGITSCPVCNTTLSMLDSFDEEELMMAEKEKYPEDFLSRIKEANDDYIE